MSADNVADLTSVVELAQRYASLSEARANIDEQLDFVKSQLRDLGAGHHEAGALTVIVTPNRRLDEARFAELFPAETHPEMYSYKPDTKKVRHELAPSVVDDLMVEAGAARVSVK